MLIKNQKIPGILSVQVQGNSIKKHGLSLKASGKSEKISEVFEYVYGRSK